MKEDHSWLQQGIPNLSCKLENLDAMLMIDEKSTNHQTSQCRV